MLKNRLQSDAPTVVPVVPNPMGPTGMPQQSLGASGNPSGMVAPAAPVAPSANVAPQPMTAPLPTQRTAQAPDIRQYSPAELAAASRSLYKETGNGFSAFGQGIMNAQALKEGRARDIALQDQEAEASQARSQKQIDYLERMSPELAEVARSGLMTPQEAYKAYKTENASGGAKRDWKVLPDGRYGWANATSGEFEELGVAQKPQNPNSAIGKLADDYKAGRIDEEQYKIGLEGLAPSGMTIESTPDGGFTFVQGATTKSAKPMTEGQANSNIFASRMEKAGPILDELEQEGTQLWDSSISNTPLVGNYLISDEYRRYDQAKRDFINATLRKESGAVINPDEFENAEIQYFPRPGDDPATIAQKKENRKTATIAIREASGKPSKSPESQDMPEGVDGDLWGHMTDEEKALWN